MLVYAVNGANPVRAPEHVSHNVYHFYAVTEYSLNQLLRLGGFTDIRPFACNLYAFRNRPDNHVGLAITRLTEMALRLLFRLYGMNVRILSERIAATAVRAS